MMQKGNEAVAGAAQPMRNRPSDTMPMEGQLAAQEMEAISGAEGSLTIPREIMERGMANARPPSPGMAGG